MTTTGVIQAIALLDASTVRRLQTPDENCWRHIVSRIRDAYIADGCNNGPAVDTAIEDVIDALEHSDAADALIRASGCVPPR